MVRKRRVKLARQAVGYVRVSTLGQATEGVSLAAQRAKIEAYATANDLELVATHADELTGKRADNRPGLQAAINDACEHEAALIVFSLSRLARSTVDAIDIATRLEKCGADLVSLSESIDTRGAAGKMVFRLLAVLAEFERDVISERVTAALAYKRQRGERISFHAPFGFDHDGDRRVPNKAEQKHLRRMVKQRQDGWSLARIAADLERRQVATKTGGTTWHPKVIGDILRRAEA